MFSVSPVCLENTYSRLQHCFLGDLTAWMGRHINETPKRHILGLKDVTGRIDRQNRSTGATCARDEVTKNKKTKKQTWQWQTGYSPRPPTLSVQNEILHGGWTSGDSSKVRISSLSVKRFRNCGWSKSAHSHWLGHWLIQQLVLPYKPWLTEQNLHPPLRLTPMQFPSTKARNNGW